MEIGGYRELDLRTGFEYYKGAGVARLNSGRAGILHALRCCGCKRVLVPYYQCSTVPDFLNRFGIEVLNYNIDRQLRPILDGHVLDDGTALLVVNYFGLISQGELKAFAARYPHVIIDNMQAFYSAPVDQAYCVYSPRKFFGVSDGCYVIGPHVEDGVKDYPVDLSSETASFLLRRIETGGNQNYSRYQDNVKRIDESGVRRMSVLTHALLDNVDYAYCAQKRRENFFTAHRLLGEINRIPSELLEGIEADYVPMIYPLIVEDSGLRVHLKENRIFVGQWWKYLLTRMDPSDVEYYYSDYLIPVQIDQRYSEEHLLYTRDVIHQYLSEKGR